MIDSLGVSGRSSVRIDGFASFFLEDIQIVGGQTEITGRFIRGIASCDLSESQFDYGLRGVRLIR
jgi:hypothetical protein